MLAAPTPPTHIKALAVLEPAAPRHIKDGLMLEPMARSDIISEVLSIIFRSLDCEGTRKLASVSRTFRDRSYSAVAVAEFRESQIKLLGLFQSFQVAALRDGRARPGGKRATCNVASGRRAFTAKVEDSDALSSRADDLEVLSTMEAAAAHAAVAKPVETRADPLVACGTLGAHDSSKGVRLPLNLSLLLRSSLSDRERRLLALGESFQKRVMCTFKVGKQHGAAHCSVKCTTCGKYACKECHEAQRCSLCMTDYCSECWELPTAAGIAPDMCGICHESVCANCREQQLHPVIPAKAEPTKQARQAECLLCPVFVRGHTCQRCIQLPHCAACDRHCTTPPRPCDACGAKCCSACIEDSPYCQLCGEFSLWCADEPEMLLPSNQTRLTGFFSSSLSGPSPTPVLR